jgi:hypothetical protein
MENGGVGHSIFVIPAKGGTMTVKYSKILGVEGVLKTIGIVGTRRRDSQADLNMVRDAFVSVYEEGDQIVSGGCPQGGDRFAEVLAKSGQVAIKIYYAKWAKFGRSAGFQRNSLIATDADVLIACVAPDRTGGTEDTIKKFMKLGKTQLILV